MNANRDIAKRKKHCSVCGTKLTGPVITYPQLPLTGMYAKRHDPKFIKGIDLFFHVCDICGHAQISNIIDPSFLYNESYVFRTSESATSRTAIDNFLRFLGDVAGKRSFRQIIDVGCNDLYLLDKLKGRAKSLVGIDPIWAGKEKAGTGKVKLIGNILEDVDLGPNLGGTLDLVLSTHTLEHIASPRSFIQQLFAAADEDTLFIFEFPGFGPLLKRARFDQIFHQHLQYFTLASFRYLLAELGGELIASEENYRHWGAMLVAFKRSKKMVRPQKMKNHDEYVQKIKMQYGYFRAQMERVKDFLCGYNGPVYGYGAALMLPALFYHLGIGADRVRTIIDDDRGKSGLSYINLPVTIRRPDQVKDISGSAIMITALDNARPILQKAISMRPMNLVVPLNVI